MVKKSQLVILAIILIVLITVFWVMPSTQKKEDLTEVDIEADVLDPLDEINPEFIFTEITTYENQLAFLTNDFNKHFISYFDSTSINVMYPIIAPTLREYLVEFDEVTNTLTLTAEDSLIENGGKQIIKTITLNQISKDSITLTDLVGLPVKYKYMMHKTIDVDNGDVFYTLFVFLDSQEFNTQFNRKLKFNGTDTTMNGKINETYYLQDNEVFGLNPVDNEYIIAQFSVDTDGDGAYDLDYFIDTENGRLLNFSSKYYNYGTNYPAQVIYNNLQKISFTDGKEKEILENGTEVNFSSSKNLYIIMKEKN